MLADIFKPTIDYFFLEISNLTFYFTIQNQIGYGEMTSYVFLGLNYPHNKRFFTLEIIYI